MAGITLDSLAYARKLMAAGVDQKQAEAMAEAQKEAWDQLVSSRELASRRDLSELKIDLARRLVGSRFALAAFLVAALAWLK